MTTCAITAVIPTYNRSEQLLEAVGKILGCNPHPDEIIVHIDANDAVTATALHNSRFQDIKILTSVTQIGPGGGRNRAIAQAKNPIVASFDDDSYPLDSDYFQRLLTLFQMFPSAAVIGASIYHIGETIAPDDQTAAWVSEFVGCGCAYRKEVFQETNGYVQLPVAYGMEEVDLSLRLHHLGWGILTSSWLRVFHDTRLEHHSKPHITAASISNQILLAYLRYPIAFWWLGIGQCFSRIIWLVRHDRIAGIRAGVSGIPKLLWQHQNQRQVVSAKSLLSYLRLRRSAVTPGTFTL